MFILTDNVNLQHCNSGDGNGNGKCTLYNLPLLWGIICFPTYIPSPHRQNPKYATVFK